MARSYNPANAATFTVWAISFSLATTREIDISFFSCRYLDVSVLCVGPLFRVSCLQHDGFPHSDISGSLITSISPKLFAGSRVLLLLLVPRHPPYALNNFSYFVCFLGFYLFFSFFRISKVSLEIFFLSRDSI